jgi:hypothetical protein
MLIKEENHMQSHPDRQDLHLLVDRITDSDVATTRKFLRALADPLDLAFLNAPDDDEPLSVHEQAAWDADQRRRLSGEPPIPHQGLLNDLGISDADLR